jgi:hypothetical protein
LVTYACADAIGPRGEAFFTNCRAGGFEASAQLLQVAAI